MPTEWYLQIPLIVTWSIEKDVAMRGDFHVVMGRCLSILPEHVLAEYMAECLDNAERRLAIGSIWDKFLFAYNEGALN